ncbi:hypothetical protein KRP22_001590 [Phytophthora ramorum]|nr:hypothetical protein KRP22_871 [Phytophthora ramorum]
MCRVAATIAPLGIFFGPSTATLADFQSLAPVALPLCSSYVTSKTDLVKTSDARPKLNAQRSGLQFVPSAGGTASLSWTRSSPER